MRMNMKVARVLGPDEAKKWLGRGQKFVTGEQVEVTREASVESVKGLLRSAADTPCCQK